MSGVDLDEKAVCGTCIGNKFLSQKISASETTDVACDYCGRNAPTLGLDEIAQIFDHEFQDNYQVADNILREDHGYPSLGDELQEIIQQEVEPASHALSDDLFEIVRAIWERDAYDGQAPEADALFIKTGVADHWLHRRWHDMQESLRTRTRFVNPDALEVLQMVFDKVDKDVTASGEPLIVEVGPGHELGTLFRARVFQNDDALEKALEDPDAQLGPPPLGCWRCGTHERQRHLDVLRRQFARCRDCRGTASRWKPRCGCRIQNSSFNTIAGFDTPAANSICHKSQHVRCVITGNRATTEVPFSTRKSTHQARPP